MDKRTKEDWDKEWERRTLEMLLMDALRAEMKERLLKESLGDADYEAYKASYFDFIVSHSEAVKKLNIKPGGATPDPDD
jgi:hypothetical protein